MSLVDQEETAVVSSRRQAGTAPLRIGIVVRDKSQLCDSNAVGIQTRKVIQGLQHAGCSVRVFFGAPGRRVLEHHPQTQMECEIQCGISSTSLYKLCEGALRFVQGRFRLAYLGAFDNHRLFEAFRRSFQPLDVLHIRDGFLSVAAPLAAAAAGKPYVLFYDAPVVEEMSFMGIQPGRVQAAVAGWMQRRAVELASHIVCVSQPAKDRLVDGFGLAAGRVSVLANCVDCEHFRPLPPDKDLRRRLAGGNGPIVMFSGSFHPWHDLATLIRAFTQLIEDVPESVLCMVGDGDGRKTAERLAAQSPVGSRVRFLGKLEYAHMPQVLNVADVLVAPIPQMNFWGSPTKIFEYMAVGKPVVASDVGDVSRYIIPGHSGMLCQPGDPGDLRFHLRQLLQEPVRAKMLGQNARRRAETDFALGAYTAKLLDIYDRQRHQAKHVSATPR